MSRILITVHKFFPDHRAGTEVLTLKIAQELKQRGHEILIVTADPPDTDARHNQGPACRDYEYEGIAVHVVMESLRLTGYSFEHEYMHPQIQKHFGSLIDRFKPDFIHVMHAQNLSASVIREAKARGLKVILSPTDFWFICPIVQLKRRDGTICEGPGPIAEPCLTCYTPELIPPKAQLTQALEARFPILARVPGGRAIASLEALYNLYKGKKMKAARKATIQRPTILRETGNSVDAICVPTKIMKSLFIKNGFKEELIHHIPFGIDTSLLEPYTQKTASDCLRIGFIGTLYEHKGVDILIRAFQKLSDSPAAILKIYGDPDQFPSYSKSLRQLVESVEKKRKQIEFAGTFPNQELGKILTDIDVLIVPSRWYENTPLVIQSALATRTPLIATNLGGMSELIHHGENGFLFELNNDDDLAKQLEKLQKDRSLLQKFQDNIGPQRNIARMVDDLESLYFKDNAVHTSGSS
ncbi:MAG: glycosyltransferase family 4 protein [Candidatus Obscuribacterales bacterium]|nr:glycosyltransferase family 4 protein [Candidatus Obscuribacterales bacterium]